MTAQTPPDPVLARFRDALHARYGARVERAILFGSRARGDSRPGSDYDVAVFLHGYTTRWDELGVLADITTDILVDTGHLVSAKPFPAGEHRDTRPLMREIARDGLDL